jgi:hypothetical protein
MQEIRGKGREERGSNREREKIVKRALNKERVKERIRAQTDREKKTEREKERERGKARSERKKGVPEEQKEKK